MFLNQNISHWHINSLILTSSASLLLVLLRLYVAVTISFDSARLSPHACPVTLLKPQTPCPWLGELQPFEVSHLSFIRQSNNSEVPVDIRQNSRTIFILSSVCVGGESLTLWKRSPLRNLWMDFIISHVWLWSRPWALFIREYVNSAVALYVFVPRWTHRTENAI